MNPSAGAELISLSMAHVSHYIHVSHGGLPDDASIEMTGQTQQIPLAQSVVELTDVSPFDS